MVLASTVGILPIGSIQANVGNGQSGEPQAIRQGAQQVAQVEATGKDKGLVKSSDDNYRWLIKSSGDNQTGAIKLADQTDFPPAKPEASKKTTSYYRRADSYATNPDSDPPRYVRRLSDIGIEAFKDITWLDIGFEFRTRYEMRHNDIRHVEGGFDNPFFLRSRAFVGLKRSSIRSASQSSFRIHGSTTTNLRQPIRKTIPTTSSKDTANYISRTRWVRMIANRTGP